MPLGNFSKIGNTNGIMPFLHLHCMKDTSVSDAEASAIADAAGIPIDALVSARPFETPVSASALDGVSGLLIGGSAWSVFEEIPHYGAFLALLRKARSRLLPMFGICFGAQAIAYAFGGLVVRDAARAEYGTIDVHREDEVDDFFSELPLRFRAQAWHQDRIARLPAGAVAAAWSRGAVLQAFSFRDAPIWGVQFHPERTSETFEKLLETRPAPCEAHPIERIRASLVPTPRAASLLSRFVRRVSR